MTFLHGHMYNWRNRLDSVESAHRAPILWSLVIVLMRKIYVLFSRPFWSIQCVGRSKLASRMSANIFSSLAQRSGDEDGGVVLIGRNVKRVVVWR